MKTYKSELLVREFSFLLAIAGVLKVDLNSLTSVKVKKVDMGLLRRKPNEDQYTWSGGGHYDYNEFFALWLEGENWVWEKLATSGNFANGSGDHKEWDCSNVGLQLLQKKLHPLILLECCQQDTDDNGRGEFRHDWTIYKMALFDLAGFHKVELAKATEELQAEIDEACK